MPKLMLAHFYVIMTMKLIIKSTQGIPSGLKSIHCTQCHTSTFMLIRAIIK